MHLIDVFKILIIQYILNFKKLFATLKESKRKSFRILETKCIITILQYINYMLYYQTKKSMKL